jgi:CO/xanthine dehydrogenase FAD-binding subunit
MDFLQPTTWDEALAARAAHPDAVPLCGGTDVMVELNFDRRRPAALLDLGRVAELREWALENGHVRLGAAVTYSRVIAELGDRLPGLAMASRTVGSPQIRNRGTVGGNLGAASPAGDAHPPLLAAGTRVEVGSVRGTRVIPVEDFYTGVKRNALAPDELIRAVLVTPPSGPQQFSKIGTRNAMVIAVSAFACALHPDRRAVGTGIGSAAPTPRRAFEAEGFLAGELESAGLWDSRGELPDGLARAFGERVAAAASPIDDVRGSAAYRLHSLSVMARRAVTWAWNDLRKAA